MARSKAKPIEAMDELRPNTPPLPVPIRMYRDEGVYRWHRPTQEKRGKNPEDNQLDRCGGEGLG